MTKIVMTLLVRDNADLLRDNIEFHRAQGVDYFIITDNGSLDATCEIAEDYAALGVAELWREAEDTYDQARWVTRMARAAYNNHSADWVINNDADEFWTTSGGNLRDLLQAVQSDCQAVYVPRHNFPPVAHGSGDYLAAMIYRETRSLNATGAPLPGKLMHRGCAEVSVAMGNHDAFVDDVPLKRADVGGIEIHHFPVRNYSDFETKIVTGGRALQRNPTLPEGVGITWRRLYDRWQEGQLPSWFAAQELTPRMIEAGLENGDLTISTVVRDALRGPTHDQRVSEARRALLDGESAENPA